MYGTEQILEFFNWVSNLFPGSIYVFVLLINIAIVVMILLLRPRLIKNVKKTVDEISGKDSEHNQEK